MTDLFSEVVGQPEVVTRLRSLAKNPPHAYLFVGPEGSGKRAAARAFAALLLCADGGCGVCRACRLVMLGQHPDVAEITHEGSSLRKAEASSIRTAANRSPVEGLRKVLVLDDFHEAGPEAAALLLKTIEEPPASTFFVVLADDVPPELITIASRCVRLDFPRVSEAAITSALVAGGLDAGIARQVAAGSDGNLARARLLVNDPGFGARQAAWAAVPERLDGSGAVVAVVVDELLAMIDAAAEPLVARQAGELTDLEERVARSGERGAGRAELVARHKRELRRHRVSEYRFGLGELARAYRERLQGPHMRASVEAIADINRAAEALIRNPNEALLLQGLFLKIGAR
jgi:DNA polymerase-3 subunit delta'